MIHTELREAGGFTQFGSRSGRLWTLDRPRARKVSKRTLTDFFIYTRRLIRFRGTILFGRSPRRALVVAASRAPHWHAMHVLKCNVWAASPVTLPLGTISSRQI